MLDRILTVIVGVQVTEAVGDAELLTSNLIWDTSDEVDKVVGGNISGVGNTASALGLT